MKLLLPLLALTPAVTAWGALGHRTVALIASRFLTRHAATSVRELLAPTSLITASIWADYYSHTPRGRYSAPWHWIDANDSPPTSCNLSVKRDCPTHEGCITGAIANHTARALDSSLQDWERKMSLKWVIHFVGDLAQPLHTENMMRGGNGIQVLWEGHHSNLHHVWDSAIPEKIVGGKAVRDSVRWADKLHTKIVDGVFGDVEEKWGKCVDIDAGRDCPVRWAEESNALMCSYVLPKDYVEGGLRDIELSTDYFESAVGIVEEQVARAGWRLGRWLNEMFAEGKGKGGDGEL